MASVDVVVPCYQYGHYLRGCVTSVLSQDIRDIRVLIIDNASTDNTLGVARELAAESGRVEVIAHRTNLGHVASYNEGIDRASADYFMVLCADDLLAPGCLARAVSIMEQHPDVNLTFGRELIITANDPVPVIDQPTRDAQWRVLPGKELLEKLCRTRQINASLFTIATTTAVVRTSAQKQVGYYRAELPHTPDHEMWMRFAWLGAAAETNAVQGIRRIHPLCRCASVSSMEWYRQFEATLESFFANEGALAPETRRLHRAARRALGERAYWGSVANLLRGDARLSLDLLAFAFTRSPTTMVVPPIGYLFRREDAFRQIAQILRGAARRMGVPITEVQERR
jgi:glycosyltransferase involved in cell wall biosynthesis